MPKDRQYVQLSIYLATGGPTKENRTHVQTDGLCICVLVFVFVYLATSKPTKENWSYVQKYRLC